MSTLKKQRRRKGIQKRKLKKRHLAAGRKKIIINKFLSKIGKM